MRSIFKAALLYTSFMFILSPQGVTKVIRVPLDEPTIQGAIDCASGDEGDVVLVFPGTFHENIDFRGKAIAIKSDQGPEKTVIDGGQAGPVVTFSSSEGRDSVLEGFTLLNGASDQGGGIRCNGASPMIVNNTITLNCATGTGYSGMGGGIRCYRASPAVLNNRFVNNQAEAGGGVSCLIADPEMIGNQFVDNTAGVGGAIFCKYSSPSIKENIFAGNDSEGGGGALFCRDDCYPVLIRNVFSENVTGSDGGGIKTGKNCHLTLDGNVISGNFAKGEGGGLHLSFTKAVLINNIIAGNACNQYGGGIAFRFCDVFMTNNTLIKNTAVLKAGGVYCDRGNYITMSNTIVRNNSSPENAEIWIGYASAPSELSIDYSNIEGGQNSVFVDTNCTLHWGAGMIDADPLFADAANHDYHLTYSSPCRGAGDNDAVELPDHDFEGDHRIAQGTADIGADEFDTHLYCTGDATPGGSIEGKFVGLPGTLPVGLFIGSGVVHPPLHHLWGYFYLEAPWLVIPLMPIPA
ncbi:MAG: hypothetical protein ABIK28_14795 [Planctomycetota bacterium]